MKKLKDIEPLKNENLIPKKAFFNKDEYSKYIARAKEYNLKVKTKEINNNNCYLAYIFGILHYYRYENGIFKEEYYYEELKWRAEFYLNPYNTVMSFYTKNKDIIPPKIREEIEETLSYLIYPFNRSFDAEYDKHHWKYYFLNGFHWIKDFYMN